MPENSTGILWLDIIILLVLPVIIGPIFIFFKSCGIDIVCIKKI